MKPLCRYIYWILVSASVFVNSIIPGGQPYESVCARAWRVSMSDDSWKHGWLVHWWGLITCVLLDVVDEDHCRRAYMYHQIIIGRMKG